MIRTWPVPIAAWAIREHHSLKDRDELLAYYDFPADTGDTCAPRIRVKKLLDGATFPDGTKVTDDDTTTNERVAA